MITLVDSLVAVPEVSLTCTVISVDDGLLRTSTGCAGPSVSLTLYVVCSKRTTTATGQIKISYDQDILQDTSKSSSYSTVVLSYSTVVLYIGIMKVWGFWPEIISPKPT